MIYDLIGIFVVEVFCWLDKHVFFLDGWLNHLAVVSLNRGMFQDTPKKPG